MTDPSPAEQLVGAVLSGRWKLVRLVGEGGMGAVYEADGLRGEGKRAIKMLHAEFVKEEQILQRFYAEAQASRGLVHPNVAQVYESATAEDGTPYLVMELLQGIPLAAYLEQGKPIPPQQAAPIIYGVLSALMAAHAQRIVHRDLKPDNLFLVRDARGAYVVKVLDFGIAKVMDAAGGMGSKTRTGVLLGTPGYMSPEQIKNAKGVDARSDLWSVGIIFWEMLTAQQTFPAENEFARLTAVLTEEVKPIERVAPHLAAWSPFFKRALAKNLAERFQSADEMARALVQIAQGGAMAAGPPAGWQAIQLGQSQPPPGSAVAGPATAASGAAAAAMAPTTAFDAPPPGYAPLAATAPSRPLVQIPTHHSQQRPPGTPTVSSGAGPAVQVVDAPPLAKGAAWWVVGVVGFVCLGLGFVAGFLAGGH